jgi:hypothetical protein
MLIEYISKYINKKLIENKLNYNLNIIDSNVLVYNFGKVDDTTFRIILNLINDLSVFLTRFKYIIENNYEYYSYIDDFILYIKPIKSNKIKIEKLYYIAEYRFIYKILYTGIIPKNDVIYLFEDNSYFNLYFFDKYKNDNVNIKKWVIFEINSSDLIIYKNYSNNTYYTLYNIHPDKIKIITSPELNLNSNCLPYFNNIPKYKNEVTLNYYLNLIYHFIDDNMFNAHYFTNGLSTKNKTTLKIDLNENELIYTYDNLDIITNVLLLNLIYQYNYIPVEYTINFGYPYREKTYNYDNNAYLNILKSNLTSIKVKFIKN